MLSLFILADTLTHTVSKAYLVHPTVSFPPLLSFGFTHMSVFKVHL